MSKPSIQEQQKHAITANVSKDVDFVSTPPAALPLTFQRSHCQLQIQARCDQAAQPNAFRIREFPETQVIRIQSVSEGCKLGGRDSQFRHVGPVWLWPVLPEKQYTEELCTMCE